MDETPRATRPQRMHVAEMLVKTGTAELAEWAHEHPAVRHLWRPKGARSLPVGEPAPPPPSPREKTFDEKQKPAISRVQPTPVEQSPAPWTPPVKRLEHPNAHLDANHFWSRTNSKK
jgi:hypothetical protein